MRIRHIELRNFRSFAQFDLDLGGRSVFVIGENGGGKTSPLTAIARALGRDLNLSSADFANLDEPVELRITLTPDEARRFLAAIEHDPLEPLYTLALTTGMRLGELLGLRWQTVDEADLQVRVTLTRIASGWSLTEPKTPRSRRRIALSTTALAALRRQKARQAEARLRAGESWSDHGLVFTDPFGEPLFGSRITERWLRPALRRAGLPMIRFHDLRHTAATLMLVVGVNPKVVSEMLGHSSVAITLDRYSHVMPTMQAEAARRMDELLAEPERVRTRVRRIPRTWKSPDLRSDRGRRVSAGTAYRIPREPSHTSQPRSRSTTKRRMRRKKQDG